MINISILEWVQKTRPDVTWIKGPDINGDFTWDSSLENQESIMSAIASYDPLEPDLSTIKMYSYITNKSNFNIKTPPIDYNFITGLNIKLHRKSILIKGECIREEYYVNYDGTTYSDMLVKEETSYTRDSLGFPIYKTVIVSWTKEDNTFHETSKTWTKFYSSLEKIEEGKYRRSNLVSGLQTPMIGLISIAMLGHTNATMAVILEGRRFLAEYKVQLDNFVDASDKEILACLNDTQHSNYVTSADYSWIDAMTPYGITIRQFLINEFTI